MLGFALTTSLQSHSIYVFLFMMLAHLGLLQVGGHLGDDVGGGLHLLLHRGGHVLEALYLRLCRLPILRRLPRRLLRRLLQHIEVCQHNGARNSVSASAASRPAAACRAASSAA